ncbi:MAG TPA: argininosuccinate lyase [Nitrospirota bacterium]|nr:argininosuccinate lyase [Nitrospirota bacterium]
MEKKKLWGGRFSRPTEKGIEEFTESISFDKRLYKYDIEGSIAHAKMLSKIGVLKKGELAAILRGLEDIGKAIENEAFLFSVELEDIHMNIEKRLIEKIGPVGEKLHTARSRNDQIALDLRLYLRDIIREMTGSIFKFQKAIVDKARAHIDIIMPGYTHLQPAQPVLFSHYLLAYREMLDRDRERLLDSLKRVNTMPLGSGAIAGTSFQVDRAYVAELLGFSRVTQNSMDAVSDRDFVIEFLADCAIIGMHLSRLSEDLILWSSREFGFIELPDEFCTGSSMMPQKKNPDVPELIRGKSGRLYGNLFSLLTTMKGLPLTYNRDMQEDKEALFDSIDTLISILEIYPAVISGMVVRKDVTAEAAARGYMWATDVADYLVKKGIPFRTAHEITGKMVAYCIENNKKIETLRISELKAFSGKFEKDLYRILTPQRGVNLRNIVGGTAREAVLKRIREIEEIQP